MKLISLLLALAWLGAIIILNHDRVSFDFPFNPTEFIIYAWITVVAAPLLFLTIIASLVNAKRALGEEVEGLENEIRGVEKERDQFTDKIDDVETEGSELVGKVLEKRLELKDDPVDDLEKVVDSTEKEIDRIEAEQPKKFKSFDDRIKAAKEKQAKLKDRLKELEENKILFSIALEEISTKNAEIKKRIAILAGTENGQDDDDDDDDSPDFIQEIEKLEESLEEYSGQLDLFERAKPRLDTLSTDLIRLSERASAINGNGKGGESIARLVARITRRVKVMKGEVESATSLDDYGSLEEAIAELEKEIDERDENLEDCQRLHHRVLRIKDRLERILNTSNPLPSDETKPN